MSSRTVTKFGGASLADGAGVRRVGRLIAQLAAQGGSKGLLVVVSAIENATTSIEVAARAAAEGRDELSSLRVRHRGMLSQLGLDSELLDRHFAELAAVLAAIRARGAVDPGLLDHALSFGERASARIVAGHLSSIGLRAVPVDAFDLGLESDSNHGRARVVPRSLERVRAALESIDGVPVITGFVAQDRHGRLTTLGRNGSDLTASLVAVAAGAREVRFWKDVGGVMTADPKLVEGARVLRRLSYEQAVELTSHGAGVLHAGAVQPLAAAGIPARVLCVREPDDEGTLVSSEPCESHAIAVACRRNVASVGLPLDRHEPADAALAEAGIVPLHARDRILSDRKVREYFVAELDESLRALSSASSDITVRSGLATAAAIGRIEMLQLGPALAAISDRLEAMWGTPEAGFVLAVPVTDLARAAQALHDALFAASLEPR